MEVSRGLVYATATAAGLVVIVLAGVGVASLIDDDRSLTREESQELIDARAPHLGPAAEVAKWWAVAHRRRGEAISGTRGCEVRNDSATGPYRYRCEVSFRDRAGRYRGVALTFVESQNRERLTITRVSPRRAGPLGAPQQPR